MKHWSIKYGKDARQTAEVYAPPASKLAPIVVFFHGGSWKAGSNRNYRFVGRWLARQGFVAVLPNYRLFPYVKFPAFLEDSAVAVKWAIDHAGDIGGDPQQVFLMGHSAGAYNAAVLGVEPKFLKSAGVDFGSIRGWIGLSGPYDFYPRPDLRAIFPLADPSAIWNPVDLIRDRSKPALIIQGKLDLIVNYKNAVSMAAKLGPSAKLVLYPYLEHFATAAAFLPLVNHIAPVNRQVKRFLEANRLKK